jgi:hypothetical protein
MHHFDPLAWSEEVSQGIVRDSPKCLDSAASMTHVSVTDLVVMDVGDEASYFSYSQRPLVAQTHSSQMHKHIYFGPHYLLLCVFCCLGRQRGHKG